MKVQEKRTRRGRVIDGITDPRRRPRYVVTAGVVAVVLVAFTVVALGVSSTRWFCAESCHAAQDDTITAYRRSTHSQVSCMACHMPVNADPFTFVIHKAEKLGELYLMVTKDYHLPLNAESHLAQSEDMPSEQCTQCHSENRKITPRKGIIINHEIHEKKKIQCTMCHNRVAHIEDFELKLRDPNTGEKNQKHDDFMEMIACFRCHGLESEAKAPGACSACHPKDFELRPASHLRSGFYTKFGDSKGHTDLKKERPDYCRICHLEKRFCSDCHGLQMPHPKDFTGGHGDLGKKKAAVCANCHGRGAKGTLFCDACHHKEADPTVPWIRQHFEFVRRDGAKACLESCHDPTFCAHCHVRGSSR